MDTLREILRVAESQQSVEWIKQQLQQGALSNQLNEGTRTDPMFNLYLKRLSEGIVDA